MRSSLNHSDPGRSFRLVGELKPSTFITFTRVTLTRGSYCVNSVSTSYMSWQPSHLALLMAQQACIQSKMAVFLSMKPTPFKKSVPWYTQKHTFSKSGLPGTSDSSASRHSLILSLDRLRMVVFAITPIREGSSSEAQTLTYCWLII